MEPLQPAVTMQCANKQHCKRSIERASNEQAEMTMCNLVFLNWKGKQHNSDPAIGRAAVTMQCAVCLLKINDGKNEAKFKRHLKQL